MKLFLLLLIFAISCSVPKTKNYRMVAQSQQDTNPTALRNIEGIQVSYKTENIRRLANARIVYADYNLIKRDFPQVAHLANEQIDQWLLDNAAFVASTQAEQQIVNTAIPVRDEVRSGYRPKEYGRAMVFPVSAMEKGLPSIGLFDAKGVGAIKPALEDHGDGLMTLGESIREYLYEKLVNKIFERDGTGFKTVGSYAVIDAGFKVKHVDGSTSPAGIYLRQAHVRNPNLYSLFDETDCLKIELVLRKYGVTSAGAYRQSYGHDMINIQGTKDGAVLDFGGFIVLDDFKNRDMKHYYGSKVLISGQASDYPKPISELRVPYQLWGASVSGVDDPKRDNIWIWSHELATSLSENKATRLDADNHLKNMLGPVFEILDYGLEGQCHSYLRKVAR